MSKDDVIIEEILLGFLRSSKKINLSSVDKIEGNNKTEYTMKFSVDNDFGDTLVNSLNNKFFEFFNKNNEEQNEFGTSKK